MDREKIRKMRVAMEQALSIIEKDFEVKFQVGNAKFGASDVTFKVEAAELAKDGTVLTKEVEDYKRLHKAYGLEGHELGSTFTYRGHPYKIVGLNPLADKYVVNGERLSDGKRYRFPVGAVTGKPSYPTWSRSSSESGKWEAANS